MYMPDVTFFSFFLRLLYLSSLRKKSCSCLFVDVSSINTMGAETRCFLFILQGDGAVSFSSFEVININHTAIVVSCNVHLVL